MPIQQEIKAQYEQHEQAAAAERERGEWEYAFYNLPALLPRQWRVEHREFWGASFQSSVSRLSVMCSVVRERDNRRWLHVSVSHPKRLPTYEEISDVKEVFIGADKMGYSLFPPKAEHVNDHPTCLHLWHCLDGGTPGTFPGNALTGAITPDFRKGGTV